MWLSLGLAVALNSTNAYGVPAISATDLPTALEILGEKHAEDRLWQMEMARRLARGRMAEIQGPSALAADQEARRQGYTDAEMRAMAARLSPEFQQMFAGYVRGVNKVIDRVNRDQTMPDGYETLGFDPEPWTLEDSVAIGVSMARRFGTGGAGELRSLALMEYLKLQPVRNQRFDALDELIWQDDPLSTPTVNAEDDLSKGRGVARLPKFTRADSEAHLAQLPAIPVLELVPAISAVHEEESRLIARREGVLESWGSYAVVASAKRSDGAVHLLSAPQMGHSTPSPVYEASIRTPELSIQGITIPGTPVMVIGHTAKHAWGLTSGVADLEDVYVGATAGESGYKYGTETRPLEQIRETIKVKGQESVPFVRERTHLGPVIMRTKAGTHLMTVRRAFYGDELKALEVFWDIAHATDAKSALAAAGTLPLSFNVFAADARNIGWRYAGRFPVRAPGYDARLPLPLDPQAEWKGFLSPEEMPHSFNPKTGLIVNWNNKPAAGWPNMDTPVWGRAFRNDSLIHALGTQPVTVAHLVGAAKAISEADSATSGSFRDLFLRAMGDAPEFAVARLRINAYDGSQRNGDVNSAFYLEVVNELRRRLYTPAVGTLLNPSFFQQAVQPTTILRQLQGAGSLELVPSRRRERVVREAILAVQAKADTLAPTAQGAIRYPGEEPIPYINRGTYIQIIRFGAQGIQAGTVLGPGNAESGEHSRDQAPLVRNWQFKPSALNTP